VLKEGDIISIDCVVCYKGYNADAARTFPVGKISPEKQRLITICQECFFKGIEKAVAGNKIGDISYAIQKHAESNGYSVIRELSGHGIGREMHEDPDVPNYGVKGFGPTIKEGLAIAVEPMISMGKRNVIFEKDGWTCRMKDGKPSAHYENTIIITREGVKIITL
jgi:methionyl aminopeptidase